MTFLDVFPIVRAALLAARAGDTDPARVLAVEALGVLGRIAPSAFDPIDLDALDLDLSLDAFDGIDMDLDPDFDLNTIDAEVKAAFDAIALGPIVFDPDWATVIANG